MNLLKKLFGEKKPIENDKQAQPLQESAPAPQPRRITMEDIEATFDTVKFRVAGVTFKNGNRSRQTILRLIAKEKDPYDGYVIITLKPTTVDGAFAVEVWTNDELVGFVPNERLRTFQRLGSRPYYVYDYDVYGGGTADDGSRLNYGMTVTVRFLKEGATCDFKQLNPPML